MLTHSIRNSHEAGYAALVSTLILSGLITILTIELNNRSLSESMNIQDEQTSAEALQLAYACANYSLLQLAYDLDYAGDVDIPISNQTCHIGKPNQINSSQKEIITTGKVENSVLHLDTIVDIPDQIILSQIPITHS